MANNTVDPHTDTAQSPRPQSKDVFAELLQGEHAPHGPLESDFKSALFVCAATQHYTFEETIADRRMMMLGMLLASVGYQGDTKNLTADYVLKVLQELLDEGALEYIGSGAGFVAHDFKAESVGKVGCSLVYHDRDFKTNELRFLDSTGEYPLFSKFLVIPGDTVKVVINTFLGCAYVREIITKRTMVIGEAASDDEIRFRDKALSAFDVRITRDGVPFKNGDMVITEIVSRKGSNVLIVRAREVVQDTGALNAFIFSAVLEHEIPNTWPPAVQNQVKKIPDHVAANETHGRVDLRELPLVTIDGEDARDFDDAVYCEVQEDGKYHLYVAIADVSYYVRTGSAIDSEALNRCTSVYFPYYVIPMLPVELSNGICSLNPNVDRLCMVCDMIINAKGKIESYEFYPAVMNSHARLTYTEAQYMLDNGKAIKSEHQHCVPWVQNLFGVYKALRAARERRGTFEFESTEVYFLFDRNWRIRGMEPTEHNASHELIEECMIAANICAATFVKENKYETLYRIHERPAPERLEKLRAILSRYGIDLPGQDTPSPQDFKFASDQVEKLPEGVHQVIALQMLRSMMKACYSPDNVGHFGLALENYAHFTSPIRRYPDLQIHRVIKYILERKQKRDWGNIGAQHYSHEALLKLGQVCSDYEVRASDAEFDVDNSLKCEFVRNFISEIVNGTVSTVDRFGVFVTLNDFFIDGRIPVENLVSLNSQQQTFVTASGNTYHVGDQIAVRIVKVNSLHRFIDLCPVSKKSKGDLEFNLQRRLEQLRNTAVADLEPNNDDKDLFFKSIADFSQGHKASNADNITRPNMDYSISRELNLSTAMHQTPTAMASALTAAGFTRVEHEHTTAGAPAGSQEAPEFVPEPVVSAAQAAASGKVVVQGASKEITASASASAVAAPKAAAATPTAPASPKAKKAKGPGPKERHDPLLEETATRIEADLNGGKYPESSKSKKKKAAASTATPSTPVTAEAAKTQAAGVSLEKEAALENQEAVTQVHISEGTKATVRTRSTKRAAVATSASTSAEAQAPSAAAAATSATSAPTEERNSTKETLQQAPAAVKAVPAAAQDEEESTVPMNKSAAKSKKAAAPAEAVPEAAAVSKDQVPESAPAEAKKAPAKKTAAKSTAKKATTKKAAAAPAAETEAKKTSSAKAPAKKAAVKKTAAEAKAPEAKAEEPKAAAKKAPAKKAAAKKTADAKAAETEAKADAPKATTKKATAAKAPAKKATAKKTADAKAPEAEAKAEAPKATAKKSTVAKAPAKKAAAKKTAEAKAPEAEAKAEAPKATAKKASAAKAPAKKAAAKKTAEAEAKAETPKATAKKASAAKAPAKKAAAKKTAEAKAPEAEAKAEAPKAAAKKASAAKAPAKKAAAKKTAEVKAPEAEAKAEAPKAAAKKASAAKKTAEAKAPEAESKAEAPKATAKKATAKKTTAAKAPAKKTAAKKTAEAKTADAAEAKAEAPKAAAKKASAAKAPAKKASTAKAEAPNAAAKKPAAKKPAAKKTTKA